MGDETARHPDFSALAATDGSHARDHVIRLGAREDRAAAEVVN
jgi:hypothetical protein